jgi:glycosyltransferase involved in cell wall biosynthesis
MTTRVTVAIPLFNGALFVGDTIASLRAQTFRDFDLVCLDDASEDDSVAVARAAGADVLRNAARLGLAANWNRAIELSRSEFLVIAHQDDVYEPQYLGAMVRLLDGHPRAFAAHSKAVTIDERGQRVAHPAGLFKESLWSGADPQEREPAEELTVLQRGNYVIAPSVMLRASAIAQLGPFDPAYGFVTDWEYWVRGLLAGFTLVGSHETLIRFRRHERTETRAQEASMGRYEEELRFLSWLAERHPSGRPWLAIENTLLTDFVDRLASGDVEAARVLANFGHERIPRFAGSFRDRLMRGALRGRSPAGRMLRLVRDAYVRFAARRHAALARKRR